MSWGFAFLYFLLSKKAQQLGFAGLLERFRTRASDITLLTSSHNYIQFAVDCLINLQLRKSTRKFFFQRGIQSLRIYNQEVRIYDKQLIFICNDTEQSVRQLSAAISSSTVNFFLTLTCNQKMHPGVEPVLEAINNYFSTSINEIQEHAISSYMSTIVRCWSKSVQYLVKLITYSAENILGKVQKIWGRAEFQTTDGHLPHYYILLWVELGSYDENELIQCSSKSILHWLREMSVNIVPQNEKDLQDLYRL